MEPSVARPRPTEGGPRSGGPRRGGARRRAGRGPGSGGSGPRGGAVRRGLARRGGVALLVVAVVAVPLVFGIRGGYPASQPRLLSGAAWLASAQSGQLTLLDGASAEVAAQVSVAPKGDELDVVQHGSTAYAVDRTTGSIRRVDGATFEPSRPVIPLPGAGDGLRAFAGNEALFAMDARRGVLAEADPRTLAGRGGTMSLVAQVDTQAATIDDAGRLWVLDAGTGDLVRIANGQRQTRRGAAAPGTGLLTIAHGEPVLVDTAKRTATTLDPDSGAPDHTVALDLRTGDRLQVSGSPHASRLYVVAARGVLAVCDLTGAACADALPIGTGTSDLGAAVETGGRVFVPDYTTGRVWIVDVDGHRVVAQPQVLGPNVRFQLLTRDGIVFFNDPGSERAGVIRLDGGVRAVAKYDPTGPAHGLGVRTAKPPVTTPGKPPAPRPGKEPNPSNPQNPPPAEPGPAPQPVPPPPPGSVEVQIALSSNSALVGDEIFFQAMAPAGKPKPTGANWSFGDGENATTLNPSHTFTAPGDYPVSVRATFPGGLTAAMSTLVTITARPTLTVAPPVRGHVTGPGGIDCPGTCTATFSPRAGVDLTAHPDPGDSFRGWGGDCAGAGLTCSLTMDGDRNASVSFSPPPTLTVTPPVNGTVTGTGGINCPGTCSATYAFDQPVTLTAQHGANVVFTGWGGDCRGTGACVLTMSADRTVSAGFARQFTLTINVPPSAHVTGSASCPDTTTCTPKFNEGTPVTLTAVAEGGSSVKFAGWEDDCAAETTATCHLTMTGDKTATVDIVFCTPSCGNGATAGAPAGVRLPATPAAVLPRSARGRRRRS
jgi:PKD repeat protein